MTISDILVIGSLLLEKEEPIDQITLNWHAANWPWLIWTFLPLAPVPYDRSGDHRQVRR